MQPYRDLKVWQRGHELVKAIYKATESFPTKEQFSLTSQLRRAAISIPNNLAEGSKRKSRTDYAHFVNIAEGSVAEVDYLVFLSKDLGYISKETAEVLLKETDELSAMLFRMRANMVEEKG